MLDMLGTSCIYVCHLHRDNFPLCYGRMKYDIYVRHDIIRALFYSVVSGNVYYVVPNQVRPRGYVYEPT